MFARLNALLALALGAALLLATFGDVAGQSDDTLDVLRADAKAIAKSTGMSEARVLARLVAGVRLEADLVALERDYPGYAGYRWDGDDLVLMFKGGVPSDGVEQIRARSNVSVRTEAVEYSLADQDRRALATIAELRAEGVPGKDIFVTVDMGTGDVLATVKASGSSRRDALRAKVLDRLGNAAAKVEFVDFAPFKTEEAYGGGQLRIGTVHDCTVGFSVEKNSVGGVSSAGHCTGTYNYFNWVTSAQHAATFKKRHQGQWGDFGWWSTDGAERDRFFKNSAGDWNDVTGVKTNLLGLGDTVRGYGFPTGAYSGTVVKRGWSGEGLEKLICLDQWYTQGGDSGGPIYNGGSAIGLHFGRVWWDGANRSCFSQARFIDDALGVTIRK